MKNRFENFTRSIARIYRAVQRIKTAEMAELGLKGTHVMCLFSLCEHADGLSPTQLGEACCEDKAAISRAVRELKSLGFVEEVCDPGKKYRAPIVLTQKGRDAACKLQEKIENAVTAGGKCLSDEERAVFYEKLEGIADNLDTYFSLLEGQNV